ncbi:MAG TPA: carboxypeptidase-like regulatory domain-containing protein, partial [Kofleriaceae bacterium]|nr:carboxypeptidase-like regulatory domain-containing protein [Kofleriaceae bacterium]
MKTLVIATLLAGCASGLDANNFDGGDDGGGAPCHVSLVFDPETPVAGPTTTIRVSAVTTSVPGVLDYRWRVEFAGTTVGVTFAQEDHSQVDFVAPDPGIYAVHLDITGVPGACTSSDVSINVRAPGAQSALFRLRVVPPQSVVAPPLEKTFMVYGGASAALGVSNLDRGISVHPLVTGPDGGVPAYLRFAPLGAPDAIVESFADASGQATAQLRPELHSVLIVPISGSAPRRIASWSPSSTMLVVDAGSPVTGTVHDPADVPLAHAKVQLLIDGVPSTLATTVDDGSFTVNAVLAGNAAVTVEVTPPDASGLPRLSATSQTFDLAMPLQIRYAPQLVRRDLAGTRVLRQDVPVGNAAVMVVGALAAAGTVTAGTSASAAGEVRIAATADAGGTLPSTLVPSANLSAVITVAAGDLAVAALDTTAAVPADLVAPAMRPITTAVLDPTAVGLGGAVLDLVPTGALAMAAVPALHVTAGTSGAITASLADGGHYDLRFHDPAGRGAPLVIADRVAATVATTYHLPVALQVHGSLMVGGTQVL